MITSIAVTININTGNTNNANNNKNNKKVVYLLSLAKRTLHIPYLVQAIQRTEITFTDMLNRV